MIHDKQITSVKHVPPQNQPTPPPPTNKKIETPPQTEGNKSSEYIIYKSNNQKKKFALNTLGPGRVLNIRKQLRKEGKTACKHFYGKFILPIV